MILARLPEVVLSLVFASALSNASPIAGETWRMHVIDNAGRGSDGNRLADLNGDGCMDVTTAWEEDGSTRVYLTPGSARVTILAEIHHWADAICRGFAFR